MDIMLSMSGYKDVASDNSVATELSSIKFGSVNEEDYHTVLFEPPGGWCNHESEVYHKEGIKCKDGDISNATFKIELCELLENVRYIYVPDQEKKAFFDELLESRKMILNVENFGYRASALHGFEKPLTWSIESCHYKLHEHECAAKDVKYMMLWFYDYEKFVTKWGRALQLYLSLRSLRLMTPDNIHHLSKDFIISYYPNEIEDCWDILPQDWKSDKTIQGYRRCCGHISSAYCDQYDGSQLFVKDCWRCMCWLEIDNE